LTPRVPVGKREGLRLEFKGRDSLGEPASIGREVVAMLNAEGGEVWIGVEERDGCAAAIQGIAAPERAEAVLQDHLVDTIEPSPLPDEVRLEQVSMPGQEAVLVVLVNPQEGRRPYAQLKGGGRHYLVRVGARIRPMSREEILSRTGVPVGAGTQRNEARRRLLEEREEIQRESREVFWIQIRPGPPQRIDLEDTRLLDYLRDPRRTGNRQAGWGFTNPYLEPQCKPHLGLLTLGVEDEGPQTEIRQDGSIVFSAPLESLRWKRQEREIWPFALLEYPVSLFRLASALYRDLPEPDGGEVVADLVFVGLQDWVLKPYSPDTVLYRVRSGAKFQEEDLLYPEPLVFHWREVLDEPDRCAFRLVERVYKAFFGAGYQDKIIPREYDRAAGRLVLPE